MIVVRNGVKRRWALGKASDHAIPVLGLWVLDVKVEEKLSVG